MTSMDKFVERTNDMENIGFKVAMEVFKSGWDSINEIMAHAEALTSDYLHEYDPAHTKKEHATVMFYFDEFASSQNFWDQLRAMKQ